MAPLSGSIGSVDSITASSRPSSGAATGRLTAVAISDPYQVRPENRLDDQRWEQVAHRVAITVDPHAPWAAFRTHPDAIVLFAATGPGLEPVARRRLAVAATTALRQQERPPAQPPIAGAGEPSPRRVDNTPRPARAAAASSPARLPRR